MLGITSASLEPGASRRSGCLEADDARVRALGEGKTLSAAAEVPDELNRILFIEALVALE